MSETRVRHYKLTEQSFEEKELGTTLAPFHHCAGK